MNLDDQIQLEHILFLERECKSCKEIKNLIDEFYLIRKDRGVFPSSDSYECKKCNKKRVSDNRKKKPANANWQYPDW